VVSSYNRAALLAGLLDALEAQDGVSAEMVLADNGSTDDTWQILTDRCRRTPMRLLALRLPHHPTPGVPRNTAVVAARGEIVAFTDDDCLPTPGWLAALVAAFAERTVLVQGRTMPEPGGWAGPWGRSLTVEQPSGLFETANLAARRAAVLSAGGFAGARLLPGRPFGEDVMLGAAVARLGGFRYAADAVVHHRVMPARYRDFLAERARLSGFPALLRDVSELRARTFGWLFLSRRTATTDLGVAALAATAAAAAATATAWPLVASVAALPWIVALWREAAARPGRARAVRVAQLAYGDVRGLAALLAGSIRARRLLL
jgi:glycosyltransferase involved in cell wall biosynthesis